MKSRELRERRRKIAEEMAALGATINLSESREKFDALEAEAKDLLGQITRLESADALDAETRQTGAPPRGQLGTEGDGAEERDKKHKEAFRAYLRAGYSRERSDGIPTMTEEQRQLLMERRDTMPANITNGVGAYPGAAGTAGGFFVPVGFSGEVETAMKFYGSMLEGGPNNPTVFTTATGQPYPWPTNNDTTVEGEQVGEATSVTTQDLMLSMITFGAYKYSTKMVPVSLELMQDSAFDLEAYLTQRFAERLGRILNHKFTTGNGTTEPQGIVTGATAGPTAVGSYANDGSGAANTLGSDDLVALEHSVDPVYRPGSKYMLADTTLAFLKRLKDKYGRPLWLPGIAVGAPDTISGYQYLINPYMDSLQTQASSPVVSRNTVLFGRLSKYMIRKVRDLSILRLEERYAEYGVVAFLGFARYDAKLMDAGTHPVTYLTNVY